YAVELPEDDFTSAEDDAESSHDIRWEDVTGLLLVSLAVLASILAGASAHGWSMAIAFNALLILCLYSFLRSLASAK
ncbi:MAG: hypothetical protein ACRD2T_11660, partial [Thermoanaerobaculia bacterium]